MKNNLIYVAVAVVAVIVIAVVALYKPSAGTGGYTTAPTTASQGGYTTAPTTTYASTIVSNLTTATGPNLATCNGYNYTISKPNFQSIGYCNWARGGLVNVTIVGGAYASTSVSMQQQNTTTTPFINLTTGTTCATKSVVFYLPAGNYKVIFYAGASSGTCASPASMRISH